MIVLSYLEKYCVSICWADFDIFGEQFINKFFEYFNLTVKPWSI